MCNLKNIILSMAWAPNHRIFTHLWEVENEEKGKNQNSECGIN